MFWREFVYRTFKNICPVAVHYSPWARVLKYEYLTPAGGQNINEFWVFSNSEMNATTIRAEKVDGKNGLICQVSIFSSSAMVVKLSKKGYFLQFCAYLSKKSKYIKAIYM